MEIPGEVWAAVVAALSALAGVLVANSQSGKQQKAALQHDAAQRDRERVMALRKDVYFPAIEGFYRLHKLLMELPNLEVADKEIAQEYAAASSTLAPVYVVAGNVTVEKLNAYMTQYAAAYMDLLMQRSALSSRKKRIEVLEGSFAAGLERSKNYVDMVKKARLSGESNDHLETMIATYLDQEDALRERHSGELGELEKEQEVAVITYLERCSEHYLVLSDLIPQALLSVRAELDFPIDGEAFVADYRAQLNQARVLLAKLVGELKGAAPSPEQPAQNDA